VPGEVAEERARLVQETQDRLAWEAQGALLGSVHEVLIDGPSQDPAFAWEGRVAAQAPEIDGVVYLRDRNLTPGLRVPVEIVEVDGYDLVGTVARR
jgi:ribosomal protein S12 methylthiotransferase